MKCSEPFLKIVDPDTLWAKKIERVADKHFNKKFQMVFEQMSPLIR